MHFTEVVSTNTLSADGLGVGWQPMSSALDTGPEHLLYWRQHMYLSGTEIPLKCGTKSESGVQEHLSCVLACPVCLLVLCHLTAYLVKCTRCIEGKGNREESQMQKVWGRGDLDGNMVSVTVVST